MVPMCKRAMIPIAIYKICLGECMVMNTVFSMRIKIVAHMFGQFSPCLRKLPKVKISNSLNFELEFRARVRAATNKLTCGKTHQHTELCREEPYHNTKQILRVWKLRVYIYYIILLHSLQTPWGYTGVGNTISQVWRPPNRTRGSSCQASKCERCDGNHIVKPR